ncbi:MAG: hypothetical protein GX331_06570 [Firmicutes bacterium]|nr:hypothetical protein [Bacillota bacterium]
MEFIVPIGVIIYIIMAVLGALIQSMASKDQPKKGSSPKRVSVEAPQPEMEPVSIMEADSMDDDYEDESILDDDWEPLKAEKAAQVRIPRWMTEPSRLAQAVIMSEVIREPRSKRPWPIR